MPVLYLNQKVGKRKETKVIKSKRWSEIINNNIMNKINVSFNRLSLLY